MIFPTRYPGLRGKRPDQGQDKERQPADKKGENHNTHCQGGLPLLSGIAACNERQFKEKADPKLKEISYFIMIDIPWLCGK